MAMLFGAANAGASLRLTQAQYLSDAHAGVAKASAWANPKYHWYNGLLKDPKPYPQATIWEIVPLWESVDYIAIANPAAANVSRVKTFAKHAETYWDRNITPAPGVSRKTPAYAPYPGSHDNAKTFFDDNSWWGLAFLDASNAMQKAGQQTLAARYLSDAKRAAGFVNANSWDNSDGGMWWNTYHTIRSGEALGSATELSARLYQLTKSRTYLAATLKYITWANHNLLKWDGSYANQLKNEATMPHDGEGAMIAAFTALCQAGAPVSRTVYAGVPANHGGNNPTFRLPDDPSSWCSWAEGLAHKTAFGVKPGSKALDAYFPLNEGPQWDDIYLRGLLTLYAYDKDKSWVRLADQTGSRIVKTKNSKGLYLKAWNGSTRVPGTPPNEIRTHGAGVSVLAALAAAG